MEKESKKGDMMKKRVVILFTLFIVLVLSVFFVRSESLLLSNQRYIQTGQNDNWYYIKIHKVDNNNEYLGVSKNDMGTIGLGSSLNGQLDMYGRMWLVPAFKHPSNSKWYLCPLRGVDTVNSVIDLSNGWKFNVSDSSLTCYRYDDTSLTGSADLDVIFSMTTDSNGKTKINVSVIVNGVSPTDTGFGFLFRPQDQSKYRYVYISDTWYDLTDVVGSVPIQKVFQFFKSDYSSLGHTFDWTDMLDVGNKFSEIIQFGASGKGLLVGTYGYGASNTIEIDPIYAVDYSPIPGQHLINGILIGDDNNFANITDITAGISDDNDTTNYAVGLTSLWSESILDNCENIIIINVGSTTLTDFPAYINLTKDDDMLSDYSDIRFYSNACNNGGSELPFEIENYTSTKADIWVKTNLSVGNNTISVYYNNNTGISPGENMIGVWNSNYVVIQHLQETDIDGGSGDIKDSTSYGYNGTTSGMDTSDQVIGRIDGSFDFDEIDDYVEISLPDVFLDISNNDFTISFWFDADDVTPDALPIWIRMIDVYYDYDNSVQFVIDVDSDMEFVVDDSGTQYGIGNSGILSVNTMYYVTGVWDATTNDVDLYLNGVEQVIAAETGLGSGAIQSITLARRSDGVSGSYFDGIIDEFRVSDVTRTVDWINQSYQMVVNQGNYVVFGDEEYKELVGDAISGKWLYTYNETYDWWLRLNKVTSGTSDVSVYAYLNETSINVSVNNIKELVGVGWFNVNISSLMDYQTNILGFNYSHFRFWTDETYNFSEVLLRKEFNDTILPYITDCRINDTLIYNNEVIRLQCNVTDDLDVEYVNVTINDVSYNFIKDNDIYYYDITCSESIGGFNNWSLVEVWDIANNYNSTNPNLNFTCIYDVINITLIDYYGLNSSLGIVDNFTTDTLEEIEYLVLNYTITSKTSLSSWYYNFTSDDFNPCSLGNKQSSLCYYYPNFIQFIENVDTSTYDGTQGNIGDSIIPTVTMASDNLSMNVSLMIDEHYNPNVFKWYDAIYNFSDVKLQNGTQQRITNSTLIKVELNQNIIPLDADQYKLDFRIGYSGNPQQKLSAFMCNSSYVPGVFYTDPICSLVCNKYPSELQDVGTKFRCIFTKELVDELGDIKYVLLASVEQNISNYYYIKSYKATASNYTTHWEYSNNLGINWFNLGDGYETELNINWFYNSLRPTTIISRLYADTLWTDNYLENNVTWDIDPTNNYPPLGNVITPIQGQMIVLPFNITFLISDPNDDVLNGTLSIHYTNGTLYQTLNDTLTVDDVQQIWDDTIGGYYDIYLRVCEINTTESYCDLHIHNIYINGRPTIYNITALSDCDDVCTFDFYLRDDESDSIDITDLKFNITYPINIIYNIVEPSYYLHGLLSSPSGVKHNLTINAAVLGISNFPFVNLLVTVNDGYYDATNNSNSFSIDTTGTKKVFEEISVGPEYGRGDTMKTIISLQDYEGLPVFGEDITIRVYYPDYSQWFNDTMTEIIPGIYEYEKNITYLSPYGDYVVSVYSNRFFTTDIFQVQPFIDYIEEILNIVVSINDTVEGTYELVTNINTTINDVYSYLQNTIYPEIDSVEENLTIILEEIRNLNFTLTGNLTIDLTPIYERFDMVDSNLTVIYNSLTAIDILIREVNQSLTYEVNENQNRLDIMNGTINSIRYYLENNITIDLDYIINLVDIINYTTENIYSYLQNTIYPEIDEVEEKIDEVLVNTTNIYNKLIIIENNVTKNQIEIFVLQNMLQNVNQTLITEINQNENKLDIIDGIVDSIYSYITVNMTVDLSYIISVVDAINLTVDSIYSYLQNTIYPEIDNVEEKLDEVLVNTTNIWDKLVIVSDNVTTNYNRLLIIENMIENVNQTLLAEINENENYLVYVNSTTLTILNRIQTIVEPKLDYVLINISDMQTDLDTIYNNVDTLEEGQQSILGNLTMIETKIDLLQFNFTSILTDISNIDTKLNSVNLTMTQRFNTLDVGQSSIISLINDIESKLDCNFTINVICDKLDEMTVTINNINSTSNFISGYLTGTITNYLIDINQTVYNIYDYLQNVIYPEIDDAEEKLDEILINTSNIWDKLILLQTDINNTYNKIVDVETLVIITNQTLVNEINENENRLINLNVTVTQILTEILTVVEPALLNIQINISDMQIDIDTIINKIDQQTQYMSDNFTLLNQKIDSLQFNFTSIITDISNLDTKITSMNLTMIQRFDTVDTTLTSIIMDISYIEAKLDCNHTINVICDRLDNLMNIAIEINQTSHIIDDYLTGTVTNYLININQTVNAIYDYLRNTIYPAIDEAESKLDEILINTTNIWDKLLVLESNITINYDELIDIKYMLENINLTIINELNENENILIIMNNTVNLILSHIQNIIEPSLTNIENNLTDLQVNIDTIISNTDTLEQGQLYILSNISLLNQKIDDLQFNFSSITIDINSLTNSLLLVNISMHDRFNSLETNQNSIISLINDIESKLDCNFTINVICDKLDEMTLTINNINSSVNYIRSYVEGNVTDYLYNIYDLLNITDSTINEIYDFLFNQGRFPSEIDLLLDGVDGDLTRSQGTVNITTYLVNPINSTGEINLYIDNQLNETGYNYISKLITFTTGNYIIRARFEGDNVTGQTTEIHRLIITTNNTSPSVNLINPTENESMNLPYNITFSTSDNDVLNVSLFLYQSGVLNKTFFTDYSKSATSYYWGTSQPSGVYDIILQACELNTFDLFCVNDSHQVYLNLSCIPSWSPIYGSCQIDDSRFLIYNDTNQCGTSYGLPGDNGTYVYCNYCSDDIVGPYYVPTECPENQTQFRYYIDNNYATCCQVTGLMSDCSILYSPYTNQTINCSYLATAITLELDTSPYIEDRMHIIGDIGIANATKCWTYVKKEDEILQTSPQKLQFEESLLFSKTEESREYFTPVGGVVSGYYRKENLLAYNDFVVGMRCALSNGTILEGEKTISPIYKDLRRVTARSAWGVQELPTILFLSAFIILVIFAVVYAWKR